MANDDIITLNVGGVRHETKISTLLTKPGTKLYSVGETAKASGRKEFYFDRNPQIFPCILNFYRIGTLHIPNEICGPAVKAELDYWELEDKDIEECCWVKYISYEDTMCLMEKFQSDEREKLNSVYVSPDASLFQRVRPKVWQVLQDPYSSHLAMAYAVISMCIVLVSIIVFIIETLPFFNSVFIHFADIHYNITNDDLRHEMDIFTDISANDVLYLIDNTCNIFFFLEFILKLVMSPDKKTFFRSPMTIVELLCVIPYYIAVIIVLYHPDPLKLFLEIRVLIAFRVMRIFRIFVVMKHFLALKILVFTVRVSTNELFLLLIVLLIGVTIFACIEYYMEKFTYQETDFQHIPLAFWWALITMTTVGYGDLAPKSGLGYVIGSFCAISGVLVIALSVPIIVNNFTHCYLHAQSREKLKLRKQKFEQTKKCQRLKVSLNNNFESGALSENMNGFKKKSAATDEPANKYITKNAFSEKKLKTGRVFTKSGVFDNTANDAKEKVEAPLTLNDVVLEDYNETSNDFNSEVVAEKKMPKSNGSVANRNVIPKRARPIRNKRFLNHLQLKTKNLDGEKAPRFKAVFPKRTVIR